MSSSVAGVRGLLNSRGKPGGPASAASGDDKEKRAKAAFEAARAMLRKDDASGSSGNNSSSKETAAASQKQELQTALRLLTEAVHDAPAVAAHYFARAQCYYRLHEYKLALFDFTMAIQIDDEPTADRRRTTAMYYGARGQCFRQMGKLDDSIADFRKAKKLEPDSGTWFYELGVSFYDLGDKHRAIDMFTIALEGVASAVGAVSSGGKAGGNTTVRNLPKVIRTKALVYRGNTRRELGFATEAIADLLKAVEAEESASNHNLLGLAYFADGDYRAAAQSFQRATDLDGSSAMFVNNLGLANFQLGRYEESLVNFREACNRDNDNASIYFNRGNAELALKDYSTALVDFTESLKRAADDENVYHSKGIVFQELRLVPAAIEQFKEALKINPNFRPSLFHLGLMHHVDGDLFASMECFAKVLAMDRNDRRAYEGIGLVYCDLLYFDLAVGAFTKALELAPQSGINRFYRGKSFLWLSRYEEAVADFDAALAHGCTDAQVYNCRALALKHMSQYPRAIADLTHAIELDRQASASASSSSASNGTSASIEYWYNRALCYLDVGEHHRAVEDLTKAIASDVGESRLYYLRGKAQYALKRYEDTITDLRKALELEPNATDSHECHYLCGIALANLDRHADALEFFTQAVSLRPNMAAYVHERAKSLQNEGRFNEAVVDFSKVIALQPMNAHAFFRRGFALKSLKRFAEAAEDFEMARHLEPSNPLLVVNYRNVYDVEFVELCAAGDEPSYDTASATSQKGV